jgi:hypothetical protein
MGCRFKVLRKALEIGNSGILGGIAVTMKWFMVMVALQAVIPAGAAGGLVRIR